MQSNNVLKNLNEKRERNYGIDLLRLVSMFMIVILHVLGKGGVLNSVEILTFKGELFWSLEILCYGAVNIYAIISGYVGYKTKHKASNLITLCLHILFFAIIITSVDLVFASINNTPISFKETILNFFPTIRKYWYFSSYFCLFFFMPILDIVIDHVPRKTMKIVALFCFVIFCCWTQIYSNVSGLQQGYSVFWLAILYLVGAYIKKYNPFKEWTSFRCLIVFLIFELITILSRILIGFLTTKIFGDIKGINILVSYTSPTITIASIFIFVAFCNMKISENASKVIKALSPMAFGVYVIHCHPILFTKLGSSFVWITQYSVGYGLLLVIAISLAIFIVCLIVDYIRLLLFKLFKVNKIVELISKVVQIITNFIFKILRIKLNEDSN